MADKVQRGGEVQPDTKEKGSEQDKARHEFGIPEPPAKPGQGEIKPKADKQGD